MSNGAGGWLKGVMVTSPILLAAVASVFLVASSIINPPELIVFIPPEDPANQVVSTKIEMSAEDIYLDFLQDPEDANNQYLGNSVKLTATIADWGLNNLQQPILTLYSDDFDNAKIICRWYQIFDEIQMPSIVGTEIILMGICDGLSEDKLHFSNCSSLSVPTRTPIEESD